VDFKKEIKQDITHVMGPVNARYLLICPILRGQETFGLVGLLSKKAKYVYSNLEVAGQVSARALGPQR